MAEHAADDLQLDALRSIVVAAVWPVTWKLR
jgi:hypothetical protein